MRHAPLSLPLFLLAVLGAAPARAQLVEIPAPNTGGAACDDMDTAPLAAAIDREVAILSRRPASERWRFGALDVSVSEYVQKTLVPLAALARRGPAAMCAELTTRFRFFRDRNAGAGKFTIYNNPVVRASRTQQGPYQFPIYRRPPGDMAKMTSAQILDGGLAGKGLELFYLADPILVMRIHIEGSATIFLEDGTQTGIGTDGHNGQTYATMHTGEAIKELKKGLPALWTYWKKNPKYVFFKEKTGIGGGRFGELTAGRTLAIDPTTVPQGAAAWIRADKPAIGPNGKAQAWFSYGRVALAQDTGSAIKGPARVDVFFGTGDYADQAAKQGSRPGEIYILLGK